MQYNRTFGLPICALLVFSGCGNNANQLSDHSNALVLTRDSDGYDAEGYNPMGLNKDGFDRRGYDIRGCDNQGKDFFGMTCDDRKSFADNKVSYQTYTALKAQHDAQTALLGTCTTDLQTCDLDKNARVAELTAAQGRITNLRQSIVDKDAELAAKNNELAAKDITLAERQTVIGTLTGDIIQLNLQITANNEKILELNQKAANLVGQNQDQINQITIEANRKSEELTKELTDIKSRHQQALKDHNEQVKLLKNEFEKLQPVSAKAASSSTSNDDELQKTLDKVKEIANELPEQAKLAKNLDWTAETLVELVQKMADAYKQNLGKRAKNGRALFIENASLTKFNASPTKLSEVLGDRTNTDTTPVKGHNSGRQTPEKAKSKRQTPGTDGVGSLPEDLTPEKAKSDQQTPGADDVGSYPEGLDANEFDEDYAGMLPDPL